MEHNLTLATIVEKCISRAKIIKQQMGIPKKKSLVNNNNKSIPHDMGILLSTRFVKVKLEFGKPQIEKITKQTIQPVIHFKMDKIERKSYLTVYRDKFLSIGIDIFADTVHFVNDSQICLPHILHNDKLLYEIYSQFTNCQDNIQSDVNTENQSKNSAYFSNKRGNIIPVNKQNLSFFYSQKSDDFRTFISYNGSFGMDKEHNLMKWTKMTINRTKDPPYSPTTDYDCM